MFQRSSGARITDKLFYKDLRLIVMENESLSLVIIPEKGTDIVSFVDKISGIDVLAKMPAGLRSPKSEIYFGGQESSFHSFYEGGWQVIFPVGSDFGQYYGRRQPFHGEACQLSWDYRILEDSELKVCVEFCARTVLSHFEIKRRISLDKASPEVLFEESIENLSPCDMKYMWGHHPAFGAPFLSEDCRIELPPCRLFEGDEKLLDIPPEGQTRKAMFYALDLERGIYGLKNKRLGFGFGMKWDHQLFSKLWIWQSLHPKEETDSQYQYMCALEPFTSLPHQWYEQIDPLPVISSGEKIQTQLRAFFYRGTLPT